MKITTTIITLFWLSTRLNAQSLVSGEYDFGLRLAYDSTTNKLTGYFENYTGWDEELRSPRFSCIFYMEGTVAHNQFAVDTYYPNDTLDIIHGNMQLIDNTTVMIKLMDDHGGCWNVQHFAKEPVKFSLEKPILWTQIRFVTTNKSYFYTDRSKVKKLKSYLIKNDFVCVEKIQDDWAYCTFYGNSITKGWIWLADLNK